MRAVWTILARAGVLSIGLIAGGAITPGSAATDDALVVLGDRINLRAEPSTAAAVVQSLAQAQRMVELGREGAWIKVRLVGSGGTEGWVHASLVGPDEAAIDTETAPAPPGPTADLAAFTAAVAQLNAGAKAQGFDYYGAVADAGNGTVLVIVTKEWIAAPETFRKGNLEALFALWDVLDGGVATPVVRLIDADGATVLERGAAATEVQPSTP